MKFDFLNLHSHGPTPPPFIIIPAIMPMVMHLACILICCCCCFVVVVVVVFHTKFHVKGREWAFRSINPCFTRTNKILWSTISQSKELCTITITSFCNYMFCTFHSCRFILGIQNISYNLLANLTREAEVHKDMVMLSDVTDQHKSLTNRTLKSFQYISRHLSNYLYVLKCDDDTFINLMEITHVLATQESKERLYWGYFGGDCKIYNDGKYAETEWKICNLYLPYAFGGGYILSMDLIKLVASNAPYLKMYKNEDVSVGAWLAPYNIKYLFDARFHTGTNRGCKRPYILYHRVDANLTYNYYDKVQRYGYFCTKKNQWHLLHGYLYNWKVQPSKCCYRRRRNSYP